MKTSLQKDTRGIAHVGLIIVGVVVLAAVAFAGWRVMNKDKKDTTADNVAQKAAEAKCDYDDKDLCKFFTSYKEHDSFKIDSKTTADGKESTAVFESQGKDRSHIVTTGEPSFEMIVIGKATYTKAPDGTWWKQTQAEDKKNDYTEAYDDKLEEPSKDQPEAEKTQYKKVGTEACGSLTCFKYQVIDPSAKDTTEYIWFDTKDYQLRRQTTESANSKSDWTYSYENVSIKEPSPVKELGPNQYLIPGQNEPVTLPTAP